MRKALLSIFFAASLFLPSGPLFAFPDTERVGVTGSDPPFDFGFNDTVTGFILKDDRTLLASYGETLAVIDMADYALAADQPPPLDVDAGTDGRLASMAYSSLKDRVYAPQDDGDCLVYDLADITIEPVTVVIAEDSVLGPIAIDNNSLNAYIINTQDNSVNVLDLSSLTVDSTITLSILSVASFEVTAAAHNFLTDEIFFTTDKGVVFYMDAGGVSAATIAVDPTHVALLSSIAVTPNGAYVYVTNETDNTLVKIDANAHTIVADDIDLSENPGPTGIVITEVTRPQSGTGNAVYAYIGGSKGISVVNTAGDEVLDMGTDPAVSGEPLPTSAVPHKLVASSVTDGYVYTANATQTVSVITADPWVTVSSLTYSSGGSSMGIGESFTIAFQADETGTAVIRAGGDVSGSGTALVDNTGASSWTVPTADTDVTVTFNYDDNATAFEEGENDLFVFVTDSAGDRGRIATTLNVDTPPPAPGILSTGFGNGRIYVQFERLDVADMSEYRIYVDTSAAAVLTKTEVAATVAQASSGSSQEGEVAGLTNGIAYYIAMDAVDTGGNVSTTRSNTLPNGAVAFDVPQATAGPCELAGEAGCALAPLSKKCCGWIPVITFLLIIIFMLSLRGAKRRGSLERFIRFARNGLLVLIVLFVALFYPALSVASEPSSQWWSMEVKTGFWMPKSANVKNFFGDCCNLITRVQGGLLVHGRYGVEQGVGFFMKNGDAVGTITGETSRDRFNFLLIPLETNFTWRIDYWTWDYFLPYVKVGVDYWFFRENLQGSVTKGLKYGVHGVLGGQMNMKVFSEDAIEGLDTDMGINDLFLTFEAQYQYINSFGKTGLDLSGPVFSIGILFEF